MRIKDVRISGYMIRLRYPSQERLRTLRIFSTSSDVLANVADELAPILLQIDSKYAKRKGSKKSRNLRASLRYTEEGSGEDIKVLRVIPYPSSFINILSNIRRDVYEILRKYCVPILNLQGRYLYAAPANMIERIAREISKINDKLSELRMDIEAFDMSEDRVAIEQKLNELGVKYEFRVPNITDVRIVTMTLSLSPEIASEFISEYTKDKIESAIDQVISNIASNIKEEVKPIIQKIRKRRGMKKVREDLEILDEKLRGLGLDEIADEISPLMELASDGGNIEDVIDEIEADVMDALSKYELSDEEIDV